MRSCDRAEKEAEAADVALVEEAEVVDVTLVLALRRRGAWAADVLPPVLRLAPSLALLLPPRVTPHSCSQVVLDLVCGYKSSFALPSPSTWPTDPLWTPPFWTFLGVSSAALCTGRFLGRTIYSLYTAYMQPIYSLYTAYIQPIYIQPIGCIEALWARAGPGAQGQ